MKSRFATEKLAILNSMQAHSDIISDKFQYNVITFFSFVEKVDPFLHARLSEMNVTTRNRVNNEMKAKKSKKCE